MAGGSGRGGRDGPRSGGAKGGSVKGGSAKGGGAKGGGAKGGGRVRGRGRSGGRKGRSGSGGTVSRRTFLRVGAAAAGLAAISGGGAHYGAVRLNEVAGFTAGELVELRGGASTHLFDMFPATASLVPWRPLGRLDTPVEALPVLDGAADVRLFIKRDDRTSDVYGGNKVRKLEHILADAALLGRRTLITTGGAGTNHGLATALHAGALGFDVRLVVFHQPVTEQVRRNVRGFVHAGARVEYAGGEAAALYRVRQAWREAQAAGEAPYFVMPGGSSRLGAVGYVNAALELAAQVRAGVLPEPDRIFVPLGSCGTAAGLVVGCRLAGLRSRVMAVRVTTPLMANSMAVRYLAGDVLRWLRQSGGVPDVTLGGDSLDVVTDQHGAGYGHPTEAGAAAAEWLAPRAPADPSYSAKALAACLDYCRRSARPGETVLYWHTSNAAAFPESADAARLPPGLQRLLQG
jgi:D-cysteine desulfhydrase